ncbi:ComF family protein [Candidatus Saccharibacteria bacterium]|nr:ComF family protein [Candidatus Saccharibacteria bacterium]
MRDFAVCTRCKPHTPLRHVYVAQHHTGLAKQLLHQTKYERAQAGVHEMAAMMVSLLPTTAEGIVLVPVPTATRRVRQRGYDQSVVLARELSRESGLPRAHFLRRVGQAHQVGSGRKARIAHLANAFRVVRQGQLQGAHIVLVDDVITTGATLETAAKLLKKAGAARVDAIVFSQPS